MSALRYQDQKILRETGSIESCWLLTVDRTPDQVLPMLPDGYLDVVIRRGAPGMLIEPGKRPLRLPNAFVLGPILQPIKIRFLGSGSWFSLKLRWLDLTCVAERPWGDSVFPLESEAVKEVLSQYTGGAFPELTINPSEDVLWRLAASLHAKAIKNRISPQLRTAIRLVRSTSGQITVRDIAVEAALQERQLLRLFRSQIGMSPQDFCRVARFRYSMRKIQDNECVKLAQIACESGYCDQAHFAREFRRFAGMSTTEFRRDLAPRYSSIRQEGVR